MLVQLAFVLSTLGFAACHRDLCDVAPRAETASAETTTIKIVSPHELARLRDSTPNVAIIDANPKNIFDEGHVPGARWMATENIRDELPADHNALVVFYCYSEACSASHAAAKVAVAAGWTNVARMGAGISGWKAAGLPIEK